MAVVLDDWLMAVNSGCYFVKNLHTSLKKLVKRKVTARRGGRVVRFE